MPWETLPIKEIFVRHPKGDKAPLRQCVHFITYGSDYGPARVRGRRTVLTLDLSNNRPPPKQLCEKYTGLDYEVAKSFFSDQANEEKYHWALEKLSQARGLEPRGGCVAALINCTAGMHRSVAMAERLAIRVRSWDGFKAECLHLDLEKGIEIQKREAAKVRATDVSENTPVRGRSRMRHEVRATSEVRPEEGKRRGAAATADAVRSPKVATLGEQRVSWKIETLEKERHPRQRETAGRSANPRGKDKTEA